MDRRIRAMLIVMVGCFVLLFVQLNNLQIKQASSLDAYSAQHSLDQTTTIDPFAVPRGDIVTSDGHVIARETQTSAKDQYGPLRVYPYGSLFADITGYYDATAASSTGLEYEYNQYLVRHQASANSLSGLLTEQSGTDTVATTISYKLQQVAAEALAPYSHGALVAIDPRNGDILVMYGKPTFDANGLASHNSKSSNAYYNSLQPNSGSSPLINYATAFTTQPGSTFKIITTPAIFDHDTSIESQIFPTLTALPLPETNLQLHNFGGEPCGGSLAHDLAVSCDTAFAKIGLDLGAPALEQEANAFGFNAAPPIDLPADEIAISCFPPVENTHQKASTCPPVSIGSNNKPGIAYSAIGQENVAESALQNALVVAGIANGGVIMTPHLMSTIVDDQGNVVTTYKPHPYLTATSRQTADSVRQLMLGVTGPYGTAANIFPPSLHVAAKTGIAEVGTANCSSTWLDATAPAGTNDIPEIAVAAVVPATAGIGCSETGAAIAGPIVAKVIDSYLGVTNG